MKISAFPKCWIEDICAGKLDLLDWIAMSAELDCDGLELYAGFLRSRGASYLHGVRRAAERLGMRIAMMCYSPDFTQPDPAAREAEAERQREMIRVTAELGGSFCRTLSGQARPGLDAAEASGWVVSCIESCLKEAEACGVAVVMENHYKDGFWAYREFAQKRDAFLAIVDRIDSPFFGVQYDPSNAVVAGDDPVALLDAVLPRVRTVHASDRSLAPGATLADLGRAEGAKGYASVLLHGVTGKGLNDWHAIFSRLATLKDRELWVSIEDGMNGMGEMKESVDFLKAMRKRYRA